jgi:hypothetical protein
MRFRGVAALALGVAVVGSAASVTPAWAAFPATPPNDPGYAPAEATPPPCSTVSVNSEQFYLYSFIPQCTRATASDPEGASGMSVDRAWSQYSTGRPDTVLAYVEGGINWHAGDVVDLADKVYVNWHELPVPCTGSPCVTRYGHSAADYDVDHDGTVSASDYAHDPRVHDANGNGVIDPEDLIVAFSCYDRFDETIGAASWPGGQLHCTNGAASVDNDGDGYPHDISGWDFYDNQNDPATVDSSYGHANGQMRQAAAATNNGALGAGVCPRCMIMPVKAGAEALDRPTQLAEAWLYAADAGASVIISVTADVGHSSMLAEAASDVERRGVVLVESSNDFDSTDHQGGMFGAGVLPGNGLVSNTAGVSGPALANSTTTSYRERSDLTSFGPHNVFSVPTTGGSTSESTPTLGGLVGLLLSYGKDAADQHLIASPLTGPEAVQVLRATASPVEDTTLAWPGSPGEWNEQYGYGRPDVYRAMQAVAKGDIPPTGQIDSPDWYSMYDPEHTRYVPVRGRVEAPRSSRFTWTLEMGLGPQPSHYTTVGTGSGSGSFDGVLGTVDLSRLPRSFWDAPFGLSAAKTLPSAEQYAVTLRLRVSDAAGRVGEDRRAVYVHHDPSLLSGFPLRIGHGGESQPALVDLQGSGHLDIVFGDSDGYVHAVDPETGRELPGWPAHTDPVAVTRGHPDVDPGFEPILSDVAVGDLDHTGALSVVAASSDGKVYVFGADGKRRAGWPRTMAQGVVAPAVPRPALAHTRLPVSGAVASPVLYDLRGDGHLDVIQAGWDGYIHAWSPDGSALPGWPVLAGPPPGTPDPGHQLVSDSNLVATPAIAYLAGHPGPSVVERSQSTEITGDGVSPGAVGFLDAFGADGHPLSGWPVRMNGLFEYYGSAQQFITEGSSSPIAADTNGSGSDQVADGPVFSPTYLFNGDGSLALTYGSTAAAIGQVLAARAANGGYVVNPAADEPIGFTTTAAMGAFAGHLELVQAGTGAASLVAATQFPGTGNPILNYQRAYDAATAAVQPGFPARLQGLDFLGEPVVADVGGGAGADVVSGGDSGALAAYTPSGVQAPGFPKFDGGWVVSAPSVGDLLSNGHTDVVALTREGYLMAWRTAGSAVGNDQWWSVHHDEWHTGRYGTDTRPPGVVREATLHGRTLDFVAPGGDWYSGVVAGYRLDLGPSAHGLRVVSSAPAGSLVSLTVPPGTSWVRVQAFDDAGNLGGAVTVWRSHGHEVGHARR